MKHLNTDIIYVILAHNDPRHLHRQIKALDGGNVKFVIHIDKTKSIETFKRTFPNELVYSNVHFLSARADSYWGSFGLIQATLNAFKYIKDNCQLPSRVVVLSGQDYPIKSHAYITEYFACYPNSIFMEYDPIPFKNWYKGGIVRFPLYDEVSKIMSLYGGSQWLAIPSRVIDIIFSFLEVNPEFISYFKLVKIPDESFFQTLIMNCEVPELEENLINDNLRLIKWDSLYPHPRILTEEDIDLILGSKSPFARKFNSIQSDSLLDFIDKKILGSQRRYHQQSNSTTKVAESEPKKKENKDNIILLLTNTLNTEQFNHYYALRGDTRNIALLYHCDKNNSCNGVKIPTNINGYSFDNSILSSLGYTPLNNKLVPGSNHFPLLKFYLQYPIYEYYWYIEDDVRFSGDWDDFFRFFEEQQISSDFISTHVKEYNEVPGWYWWDSLNHPSKLIPFKERVRSFNPFFRISNAALQFIHTQLEDGWYGHHEVLIPTLLSKNGFQLNDFGGKGKFILHECEERFYVEKYSDQDSDLRSGSFRFRPFITKEEIAYGILYHPVKMERESLDWQSSAEK